MKLINAAYIVLHCLGIKSRKFQTGTLLPPLELQQICQEGIFKFVAHPLSRSHYILCLQRKGVEMTCGYGKCFSEHDPKNPCTTNCSSAANAVDAEIKHQCNKYHTTLLDRVPHPKDCASYFLCMGKNMDPLPLKCPPNQHFSEKQKNCSTKAEAKCTAIAKRCERKQEGLRLIHYNCFQYYRCHREIIYTETCPFGQHFNMISNQCEFGICYDDHRNPNCVDEDDGTRFSHHQCNMYYECKESNPISKTCPQNQYFHDKNQTCVNDVTGMCVGEKRWIVIPYYGSSSRDIS